MKKFTALFLCIILVVFSFCGCSKEDREILDSAIQSLIAEDTESQTESEVSSDAQISSSDIATSSAVSTSSTLVCAHKNTTIKNKKNPTCTLAGYTGDKFCKDCKKTIEHGSTVPAKGHKKTEIKGKVTATTTSEGYTGDTYCTDCGEKIASGTKVGKLKENMPGKVEYILKEGTSLWLDEGVNITEHTMSLAAANRKNEHQFSDVEQEILRLCNEERKKAGLQALKWYEDAYSFTTERAKEAFVLFEHTRPNGTPWNAIYEDAKVYLTGYFGENLFKTDGHSIEGYAKRAVDAWMASTSHRENILKPEYTKLTVSIVKEDNRISATQHFFS